MTTVPSTWRTPGSALHTKLLPNASLKCGACKETSENAFVCCHNDISGLTIDFCFDCWADATYYCRTCRKTPSNAHVVICDGCGVFEHAGCTCDASVVDQDTWFCRNCTRGDCDDLKVRLDLMTDRAKEMEACWSLEKLQQQRLQQDVANMRENVRQARETAKLATDAQKRLKRASETLVLVRNELQKTKGRLAYRSARVGHQKKEVDALTKHKKQSEALVSALQKERDAYKNKALALENNQGAITKRALELYKVNKQLRSTNAVLRSEKLDMQHSLADVLKKRKREDRGAKIAASESLRLMEEMSKRMKFIVNQH